MKKKIAMLFLCLLAFLITSCDEVLSVVTANENGEKIVNNYISLFGDTVYDESVSMKNWQTGDILNESGIDTTNLLFKIENKKDHLVVLGDKEVAVELSFFDGGYKYKLFASSDSMNNAFSNIF